MATYLVTGGGGFIGSNIVEALLARGERVRVLDDFSTGRRENLDEAPAWTRGTGGTFELREGDIRRVEHCRDAVRGVQYVLHLAAIPSVQRSVRDPVTTNDVNVNGTLHMLQAAREEGVARFVFASSSSVYGDTEALPKIESMQPAPISPYGLQKLAGEVYCRLFHALYGLPTVALRYFNVFGPRQDPTSEYSAVIPRFIAAVRDQQAPTIFGDGEQTRDFTFVSNVVHANLQACSAGSGAFGRAFNIGVGSRVSLNQLVRHLGDITGRPVVPRHAEPRQGDIRHSLAAIDLASSLLHYRPEVDLVEGLRRTARTFA